jgi:hypothetical protein
MSADAADRSLTPTPKSKVSKGKGKAKEVIEIEDDEPRQVSKRRRRRISKPIIEIDDSSDVFIYDSDGVEEEAAAFSTRFRSHDRDTKKPRGPTKKTEGRKETGATTADMHSPPTMSVIPPTPQVFSTTKITNSSKM